MTDSHQPNAIHFQQHRQSLPSKVPKRKASHLLSVPEVPSSGKHYLDATPPPQNSGYLTVPILEPTVTLTVPTSHATLRRKDSSQSCGSDSQLGSSAGTSLTGSSRSSEEAGRLSIYSYGSSFTDDDESLPGFSSRRVSTLSSCENARTTSPGTGRRMKPSTLSGGKLRQIAAQVTRAIRRKRRESAALRRESRATRVVAAILGECLH